MNMLPDDLDLVGSSLEAATEARLRRQLRRQRLMEAMGSVCVAVPLAVAVMAAPLAPSAGLPLAPTSGFIASQSLAAPLDFEHIPDEPVPEAKQICLDGRDCRAPVVLQPATWKRV